MIARDVEFESKLKNALKNAAEKTEDKWGKAIILNAYCSLYESINDKECADAMIEMLDKYITNDKINILEENDIYNYMFGNPCYCAYEYTGKETYKKCLLDVANGFKFQKKSENGYFIDKDGKESMCQAYCSLPFYMNYETKDDGKEFYNDIISQYKAMYETLFVKERENVLNNDEMFESCVYFCASIIDTMQIMDQPMYEIFRKLQDYYKDTVKTLISGYTFNGDVKDYEVMLGYAVFKGCRMKALNTERYECIAVDIYNAMHEISNTLFADGDNIDPTMAASISMCYSEAVKNREYQDYGRGRGGKLWN